MLCSVETGGSSSGDKSTLHAWHARRRIEVASTILWKYNIL